MDYKYDSESNVLSITVAKTKFDYATELGDLIVHFDKKNRPVYLEILNASKFLVNSVDCLPQAKVEQIWEDVQIKSR